MSDIKIMRFCTSCGAYDIDDNHGCAGPKRTDDNKPKEFWCNGCGQKPCIGKCEELCAHGIMKREYCDDCHNKPKEWWIFEMSGPHDAVLYTEYPNDDGICLDQLIHVIERSALTQAEAEIARLKSIPPTFIKLDETTEAFMQTHAAIENMKMFQKDNLILQREIAILKEDINDLYEPISAALNQAEADRDRWHQTAMHHAKRADEAEREIAELKNAASDEWTRDEHLMLENERLTKENAELKGLGEKNE